MEKITEVQVTDDELCWLNKYREGFQGVFWHVDDFEMTAIDLETGSNTKFYDRTKFKKALTDMIKKHDASEGISWAVIRYYLDEYCLIDK